MAAGISPGQVSGWTRQVYPAATRSPSGRSGGLTEKDGLTPNFFRGNVRTMKRTNIHLRDDQRKRLLAEADRLDCKPAELVRMAIDAAFPPLATDRRVRRTLTREAEAERPHR
jgi:hypothetical protein